MDKEKVPGKKRLFEDYSLIFGIVSLVFLFLLMPTVFDIFNRLSNYPHLTLIDLIIGILYTLVSFFSLLLGFISGIIYLARARHRKVKTTNYWKSGIGIFSGVLCIVILLCADNELGFKQRKQKQSEAKQTLGVISSAYSIYYSRYHTYPSAPSIQIGATVFNCISVAGWAPHPTRYNVNCMNTEVFSPTKNDSPCPPGIFTSATKDSFTIAACGNVDNDTTVDVWTIDDAKHLRNVVDDVKN